VPETEPLSQATSASMTVAKIESVFFMGVNIEIFSCQTMVL
jgi:hypothetical protein